MSLPIPPECCVSSLLGPSSPFSDVFDANHCDLDSGRRLERAYLPQMREEVQQGIQSKDSAIAPSVPPAPSRLARCTGIPLAWDAATFWETYPFQIHSSSAKQPAKYDLILPETPNSPRARSKQCGRTFASPDGACAKCSDLVLDISIVRERASRTFEHLQRKVETTQDSLNKLKLKNLDLAEAVDSVRKRLAEYVELIQFIGEHAHEICALHRLLANAMVNGWSANYTLEQCKHAAAGKYTACNITLYEIYLAILIYELGGGGALYALNHSIFALPSIDTIRPYRAQMKLMPSVNGVGVTEVSSNITALFQPRASCETNTVSATAYRTIYGHTLSFDEVATERRIDYLTETDEMAGLCLEHLSSLKTVKVGADTKTVEAAATAVRKGDVHISHETSVGAISRLSETGYGARPVFMGPSCKTGDWKDCMCTMEIVVEAWKCSVHGERLHGPILSIASDSDAKRCKALFMMTMHTEIIEGNPLYPYICDLLGLNRRVGKDNLTMDPDYKHKFKGTRSLLTSNVGLVVKGTCINRDLLFSWLERLTDHDWSETSLHALLDPADGQDVSTTIKLFLAIIELTSLDAADFDPNEAVEFEALCLFAEFLNAWIQPYINTDLTLSEQIESLVLASYLCTALYRQNGVSFMGNQLFAHIQASIKNAVLMVGKTRVIDGELKVFICLLGDDVLEALFGRSRMIGGHSPNCSVAELRDRFMSAMNLDWIYEQCLEFERQPHRLNLTHMGHVDHLRPRHFKRELRAKSCDLPAVWKSAVRKAEAILAKYGVRMTVPFSVLFKQPETDLLRPFGGKYSVLSTKDVVTGDGDDSDLTVDTRSFNPSILIPASEFDRMFAETESSDAPAHSLFAEINDNGRRAHKKTIVRTLFEMTHDLHTSRDRLQRVRSFTYGGKLWTRESGEGHQTLSPSTHFQQGQLFTTLICYNNAHLALAIAKCTMIRKTGSKASSTSAVPRGELNLPESVWTISGQILSLVALDQHKDTPGFVWDGEFVLLSLNKKGQNGDVSRIQNLQFSVLSRLIDLAIHEQAHELLALKSEVLCTWEKTWFFSNKDLSAAWSNKTLHDKFPVFMQVSSGVFPYVTLASTDSPAIYYLKPIASTPVDETHFKRSTCRVCGVVVKDINRQTHVGQHILKSVCGVEDPSVKVPCPAADCDQFHWKYNFQQHLEDRHPQWRLILSHDFLSAIQISSAEQQALGIPHDDVIDIPATAPPNPSFPPPSHGQKQPASSPPSSPSRRANKENEGITASNSIDSHAVHPPKIRKVILKLPLAPALQKNSRVK
ncbi:hypothetical protein B0H10DRAFT_2362255 [Mycena sp. CBHHK59/15]|nr:hypothetical protein B0H10DRAFT_2362255 [Mycena sp. CBHHK59/15]